MKDEMNWETKKYTKNECTYCRIYELTCENNRHKMYTNKRKETI